MTDEKDTKTAEEDVVYQQFHSNRSSMSMTTPEGGTMNFMHHKFITSNPVFIAYLQLEIASGNSFIRQDEVDKELTLADLDPMAALKKKHIEEFLAEQAKNAPPESRDMGLNNLVDLSAKAKGVATTKTVAPTSAGSKSK